MPDVQETLRKSQIKFLPRSPLMTQSWHILMEGKPCSLHLECGMCFLSGPRIWLHLQSNLANYQEFLVTWEIVLIGSALYWFFFIFSFPLFLYFKHFFSFLHHLLLFLPLDTFMKFNLTKLFCTRMWKDFPASLAFRDKIWNSNMKKSRHVQSLLTKWTRATERVCLMSGEIALIHHNVASPIWLAS